MELAVGVLIEVSYLIDHNAWLVRMEGEHDLTTAEPLRQMLGRLEHGDARLVVDLSPVEFIDSSTMNVLIAEYAAAEQWR